LRLPARCWRIAAPRGVGLGLRDARDDDAVLLLDRGQVGLLVGRAALLALHVQRGMMWWPREVENLTK